MLKDTNMFKKGEIVKVKAVVPEGPVVALRMSEDGVVSYLVEWNDGETTQQRWFEQDQLVAG
jgi:uncharacterized protein YodC (DUF2158 family)